MRAARCKYSVLFYAPGYTQARTRHARDSLAMKREYKRALTSTIVIAIAIILLFWYITLPRVSYTKNATLVGIDFRPPPCTGPSCPPILTFTFSQPILAATIAGSTASLRSFTVDSGTDSAAAESLVTTLVNRGGVPFTPKLSADGYSITSNSMPSASLQSSALSFKGQGEMWFALPVS